MRAKTDDRRHSSHRTQGSTTPSGTPKVFERMEQASDILKSNPAPDAAQPAVPNGTYRVIKFGR